MEKIIEVRCQTCDSLHGVHKEEIKWGGSYFYIICPSCGEFAVVDVNIIPPEWKEEIIGGK